MSGDTLVLFMGLTLALEAFLCCSVMELQKGLKYLSARVAELEAKLSDSNVANDATSFYDRLHDRLHDPNFIMAHFADIVLVLLAVFIVFAVIRYFQREIEELKAEKAVILELMAANDTETESDSSIEDQELEEVKAEKAELLVELAAIKDKEAKARLEIQDLKNKIKLIKAENEHAMEKVNIAEARVADGMEAIKRSEERASEYQAAAAEAEARAGKAVANAEARASKAAADAEDRAGKAEARAEKAAADADDRVSEQTKLAFDLSEAVKSQVKQTLADSEATKKLVQDITSRLPLIEVEAFGRGREAGLTEAGLVKARQSAGRK